MMHSEEIEILRELIKSDSVDLYLFHDKYKMSPAQLSRAVSKFASKSIISINENTITLTPYGKKWIINNRKALFLSPREKYWKQIPSEMQLENQLKVKKKNKKYMVGKSLLKKYGE